MVGRARLATAPLAADASAQAVATITSDAPDYIPGNTVTLVGGGWAPNETVTIVLHRDPLVHPDVTLTSVADGSGTITNTAFVPLPDDVDVTFTVTATGAQSGLLATTTFIVRRAITWTGAVSTDWNTAGNWSPVGVPANNDDPTIPAGVLSGNYPVISSPVVTDNLKLTAGAGTQPRLTVLGSTLAVTGNLAIQAGALNISGGTVLTSVDLDVSNGATVTVSGAGVLHMANAIGSTPSDDINLAAGATFIQSGGTVDTRDLTIAAGASYTQSGGTINMYRDFRNSGVFDATAGTLVFAANGDGNAFNSPGTNQFFNVVVSAPSFQFDSNLAADIRVRGDWTINGAADLSNNKVTTVTFNGSGAQSIGGATASAFGNLTVNKPAGAVTLARSATVKGNVTVSGGTLDLSSFVMPRTALGGAFAVSNGAFLKIGGTNSFPGLYVIHSLGATSTVDYNGTSQTVSSEDYGHLNLSGSGTKTMPGSALTTEGNFTMSGSASATAAAALVVNGNFTVGPGTTFGAGSFNHNLKGNFSNSGTFNAGTSTFTLNGTSGQTISGSNSTTFNALTIANSSGVSLVSVNTTVDGLLTLTTGRVTTGLSQFIATSSTGSVTRGSGYVVGNFQKFVPTGAPTLTYEIGDTISYTPVTLAFASVSVAGNATGSTTTGDSPNAGSSPIDPLKSVNRFWTWTSSGLAFTSYSATFTFVPGDVDPGANTNNFIVGKFSGGSWTTPPVGTRTPTSTQITGVTTFSDFEIGEPGRITTLGNGTDPANVTIAPGGAATMAGAFTFQTDGGTDTVSLVTVTLAAGTSPAVSLVEITDDAGSIVFGSVANPTSNTVPITLSTGITATTTSTQYKIRVTPKSHAAMPVPPGSNYALTALITSWSSSNIQAGSDSAGTIVTIDNLSPANVTSSTVTSGNTQVTLTWTNPADSDLGTIIVLRKSTSAVVDTPTEGATYSVGNTIGSSTVACVATAPATGCTDSGLTNGTVYHYAIFARDVDGNYATGVVPVGSPVTPNVTTLGNGADPGNATVAPGGAATMADAFTFQTGGGIDTITAVTVSLAPGTSTGVAHVEITNDAGTIVYGEVSDPVSDTLAIPLSTSVAATSSITQYKIRITPKSHAAMPPPPGSLYTLTAMVSSWTGTNAHAGSDSGGTVVTIDNLSSGNVTGATVTSGNTQNTLAWTNPTDSDLAKLVVLRQAGSPVTDVPVEGVTIYLPGDTIGTSTVACVVTAPATGCTDAGLTNGTLYHYKIFARGANGNYSTGVVPAGSPVAPNATTLGDGTPVSDATVAPGGGATMADAFAFRTGTGTDTITAVTVTLAAGTAAGVSLVEITDVAGAVVYGSVSNPPSDTFPITLTTNIIATTTTTQYRIRVTPKSHAAMPAPPGTIYLLSADVTDWVGTNAHSGSDSGNTVVTIDNLSPGNVTSGISTAGSTQVLVAWINPVDTDLGTIVVLRRAGSAVGDTPAEGATYSVGNTIGSSTVACVIAAPAQACLDTGLTNGTVYHYKIFTRDTDGNYSTGVAPAGSPATPFAGITVTPTSGLTTTEAGGTATFTVVLTSRPTADVTIALSSSDTTEGTVSPASLTFTSANWNTPRTVTVTGVDDLQVDGNIAYTIVIAPATSADAGYNGLNASDVSVTNTDNDTVGITVTPTSGLSTTEAGGTATFTVVLHSQPTADVTIGLSSSNTAEGTVSPASLTFTSANWNTPQTVTITGVNDAVADGNIAYSIVTAAAVSSDAGYNGINPPDVSVTNVDNNTVGVIVTPTTGLTTTEAGGTAAFTVRLNSQPTADVTIGLSSSDTTEGTVSAPSLTFTSANWNIPQTVTITGVNDALDDGDILYTIVTAAATSTDLNYNGINPSDVSVTNIDDDTSGITVTPTTGLTTTEAGGTAAFTIVLTSQPIADVTIGLSSSNTAEGTVSPSSMTFTSANWNVPRTVTVTGVNDFLVDGDIAYTIVTAAATSTDPTYAGMNASDVSVTNTDNDTAGITVTPTAGLTTSEAGGTATFTVVLNSQPTADVTIGLSSNDLTEGTVSPASLTFTSANWNVPRTVTVTGVDNPVDDGDIAYKIITAPATSADAHYNGFNASDVSVTNIDDDTAGIVVTPTSGLKTFEIGGSPATFTVVLTSRPLADVVIDLSSSDLTEGAVSPASLTFTSANWNVPQTVTVTGVNDVIIDGDIAYSIITAPARSGDPKYNGLDASDVSLTNIDSDTATFFLTPISGLTTTEAGGTATFTIVMNAQPSADVTVGLSSSNTNEGTVSVPSVTFTSANWNVPQTVTVTGVNDFVVDGAIAYTIVTAPATSADPHFNGVNPADVSVTNIDNDTAGITVTPPSGLVTTEAGATATFTVVLKSQPTANVTIGLSSSNTAEGTISTPSLTFTSANWNVPQTVTVTGVNDFIDDGDIAYTIITAPATSADPNYAGVNASDVSVTNIDDDTAGVTVTPSNGLTTTEAGGPATFTLVLNSQPTANVTIGLSSTNTAEGTVSVPSVTFTSANWNVPQTVTVTGVNDAVDDGNVAYTIVTAPAVSTDPRYSGVDPINVSVTNLDDDTAGITVTPTAGLTTTEGGGTAAFTVVLTSQPTANVTIGLSSSNTAEGTVSAPSLTFTPANWNVPQTVTVTGVDDVMDDGDVAYIIFTSPATSTDPKYASVDPSNVLVTNIDNDTAGFTVTPLSGLTTTEAGGTATFTIVLTAQPAANVTIGLSSSNTAEGTVGPVSVTFTSANWNVPQTVTVTGVNDAVDDGDIPYLIITAPATSTDPHYNGLDASNVLVVNIDDDTAGITVTPTSGLTTTEAGGTAQFTVVLNSKPTADVSIDLSSSNPAEGSVNVASLTFTSANWNVPQTVTVTGVNDFVVDGNVVYTIVTAPATSVDPIYNGVNASDVTLTNTDNDTAGITVTPTTGLTTTEAGGTATFTVVLTSQPTADVTIGLSSSNTNEGTVGPTSLTFTSANWNVAQTVTVTGVNDFVVDGNVVYTIVTAAATSTDPHYSGVNASDVTVTNTDNDIAGITVTPTSGLTTTEGGGAAQFTVVLNSQPSADVTIGLTSSNTNEGTVSAASLTFTNANWNLPQTVTVTGVNDVVVDGNVAYTIVTAPATSADSHYNGLNASDVTVTNADNDTAEIAVTPTSGLTTTEAGGTATFTVVLTTQPTADVTIGLSSSNTNEGTVSPASLTFTSVNWNVPRVVTVTGVNDLVVDGNVVYTIVTAAATSADPNYNGLNPSDVTITNTDNDTAGITVTPTSGLATTEAGGTATFTVVLNSQPTADVTIGLSSSNTNEGTVSAPSLTFTNVNWNVPQTVTVTGVNDFVVDGNVVYTIVTAAATSTDPNYNGVNASDVTVTNTDNDTAGITVTPTSGLTTTEAGGTATFTVVLTSQPTANVVIDLSSSDTTEGLVSPANLTFTPANWNVPQTVTVTGVDDAVVDGNVVYTIVTAAATSTDPHYSSMNASDVSVTNTDNDTAGITVTPTSGLTTTEAGGAATFTVMLKSQPIADVTIGLSSSNPAEGVVDRASLVFTSVNWNVPQTVTVTGVNDLVVDGNVVYTIVTAAATSADPNYSGVDPSDVTMTNIDNDTAGITVTPTSGLITSEAGGTAAFTVVLNSQPTANVTIGLSSSNPAEGTVSAASLTFTTGNWNTPQTVTVTGVNDLVVDGNVVYTIVTAAATSTDPNYNGINASDVTVTNTDNDVAGITVTPTSGLTTTEAGGTAAFTVVLNSQPTANVTIGLSSSNPAEGTVGPASLIFTTANWNLPQTVTVTGVNDFVVDGNIAYTIVTAPATSTDPIYNGVNASDVTVTNTDNDVAGITVTPTSGLTTTEAGGTATFTVVLNSQPSANVTIGLSSSNTAEGTVGPASLTFTNANWNVAQTVTVTGVNDFVVDGNVVYTIVTAAATSTDPNYNGLNASDVTVTNTDNDVAGITVTPTSGLTTTESGGAATFTVVLNSQPLSNVTIGLSSSNANEGTVGPASLTFTNANWNVAQTVTVTGVNDFVVDGNVVYTIVTAAATSTDPNYSGLNASDVTLTNTDNDVAGITVTPTAGLTTSEAGGTATFTVVLNTQPSAAVTIGLSSSNTAEGTVSVPSLTFTSANWNVPQTVTVTGVDDQVVDGAVVYTIVTAAATSADPNYNGLNASDVTVTNADNDTAGITVNPTAGLTTTEAGGTAAFSVVLNTKPTANVTIGLSSSNTNEGTVSAASLTFTSANWNVPQTVTVTGVNDLVVDGNVVYTIVTAAATSADPIYNGLNASDVTVTNTDNDTAGITVTPTSGLTTTEAGGTATFTVVLNSQPTANVTIGLSSNNTAEGTVGPASLVFTNANWNVPQTVTVTGVDDVVVDGNVVYTIVTAPATSTDPNYNGVNASDVTITNTDNDTAGITVTPTSGLTTTEAGGTAAFTVVLNTKPTADVTIGLSSSNTNEGTVSAASLTFTSVNWNVPQTVTVTGVNDAVVDGNVVYTIVTAAATSADPNYNGVNASDVTVTNTDNDTAGITVTPTAGLTTTEAGGTATFTVVLNSQPTADVTIGLSSSNTAEGTVGAASLTFTNANWNVPQTVTVTGVNDAVVDGNVAYTIVTAPATSTDPNYNGVNASDVTVTNTDNDTAGITVTPTSGLTTTEAGGTATFTVVLTSQPTADVTIGLSSSNTAEGTVGPASLTFTSVNWNVPQTVTVTGVNDAVVDGNVAYTIVTAAATSTDSHYSGVNASDVTVTNTDDDVFADLSVTTTNGVSAVTAGGFTTYTVVVSNAGPGGAVGATVTDTAPVNVTFGAWTCVASAGSTCPASGTGNISAAVNLLAGGKATFTVPATISSVASGTVTNTATVSVPSGAVDPTPANNSVSEIDTVTPAPIPTADLSVTKTNGGTVVTSGATSTYTVVVSNAGPNAANGAILTDPVAAGLTKTTVICAAAGGAACPASPTASQIEAGLVIPALPVGGSVTFTITATVTAASGSVSNIATIAAPAGVIDGVTGNNSATDTDTVAPAPIVADLAVTNTDNVTVLVPGAAIVYTVAVTNQGPGAVTGATVTNAAPAGLTFGNWTCVATAGSLCASSGTGNISTTVNLLPGGTATFTVPATLTAGAPTSIANTAVAAVPAGVTDPVPANNTATDVDQTVPPQSVGLALRAGAMRVVGPSAFEVPFTVDVTNTGVNPLTNLQVADSLSSAFADGEPTITIAGPPTANRPVTSAITATAPCVANPGFTGIGSELDPGTQLLGASPPLGAGQGCTIEFTVRLTYASVAVIPTASQANRVVARTSTSNGSTIVTVASAEGEASVKLLIPRVDVTKMLTGVKQVGSEAVFDISYAIVVKNTSEAPAANVQAIDNLSATFAPGAPVITIVSGPTIESGSASLTLATGANAFNGTSTTAILAGSDTMQPGADSRIAFTVRVRYASGSSVPVGIDLNNSAIATTSATPGGIVITHDESTDVTESAAPPRADDDPAPTPVRLVPQAQLAVQKIANMLVAEIGDAVQYAVRVRNLAGPALPAVSVTDRLPLGFSYIAGSARLGVADHPGAPALPDPAGGAGPVLTFSIPAQAESAEVLITYRVRVATGALQGDGVNRAEAVSGDARSNTAAARVLVSGGVFTTDACVVGAIFVDLNHNGLQDAGEPGIPDVELHFEEGTSLLSDLHGKYSYCGLTPATHVLKVDRTTLPAGATLAPSSNRNAGNAGSLFVDLKFGEVRRADFIVDGSAGQAVLDEIAVRRARADIWAPKFDEQARPAATGGGHPASSGIAPPPPGGVALAAQPTQGQTIGGFEPIRQAAALNSANSNVPEPLRGAAEPQAVTGAPTQGATPPSTALRPLLLVGLLDGAVSFSHVDGGLLAPAQPEAVFDREFTRFTGSFDSGQGQYGGRGALFLKGTVATHYLMTFAYDSDKDVRGALFRDIQPEAFYPIYGDGSEKRFDAQTSGRFYARVDRGHSYLMYGDLQTSSFSPEAQALGAYNRALTGVQDHFENSRTMINVFASHDSLRQVIDEYAARGISGPYPVSNPNGVSGTERVEIITRDRNQPALVLSAVQLTRFTDYEFEPFSGRLLFRMPVPSLDERLNPVSIRVTYEVDSGGDKSWVGGGNVQMRLGKSLQVGGSWIEDGTPGSPYRLISANSLLRMGKSSTVVIEGAQSTGTINTGIGGAIPPTAAAVDPEGMAARVEFRHTSSRLVARAFGAFSDPGFNNPASTLAGGRTEAGAHARLTITKGVSFIGEALHSEDRVTGGRRDGGLLTLETKWRPLVFEAGVRRASETGAPSQGTSAGIPLFGSGSTTGFGFGSTDTRIDPVTGQPIVQSGFGPQLSAGPNAPAAVASPDLMTVRAKLTFLIGKRTDIYGEAEQDVRSAERRVAAVGAQLKFSDKLKLYARHEFISSLDGPYALTDGQRSYNTVFGAASTYMKDADLFSEYRLADAISGREAEAAIGLRNQWALTKGVRLSTSFERVQSIATGTREATAVSAGLEYTASTRLKGTGRLEWRRDSSSDSWLSTAGIAERLSHDWTMLARNYYQVTVPDGAPNLVQDRFSIGAAFRDSAKNRVNLLTRYEFRNEDTAGLTLGTATDRRVQIVSTHVDFHPLRAWTFSGQHALKFVDDRTELSPDQFGTQLVSGRVGYDIARRWDVGALTSVMWGGVGGRRSAVGGEVGFQLRGDLWLSTGYNFTGFTDPDLVSSNFTTRGMFVRIRMKFDESVVPASAKGGR